MIKLVIDTLGGDRGAEVCVKGAVRSLIEHDDLSLVFTGDETEIKNILAAEKYDEKRVETAHAPDVISCNDKPTDAIRQKKESSMYKAIDLLKNDASVNGLVTTGSTGALLAGAVLKVGRIRGVKRPAFCPVMPTMNMGVIAICDSGANVDCDSLQLTQFAVMASLYMQKAYGVENPKVALLNVGTEEEKGDMLRKETFALLKENKNVNFVGNMEARDVLGGKYDVVVADGFAGNVLIKSTEGACLEMLKLLKKTFTSGLKNKLGALLLKKDIYKMKDFMDYNNYGGAVLLGCAKTVVKSHGSSKEKTVYKSVELAYKLEKSGLGKAIAENIAERAE